MLQDLKFAVRIARKNPGITLAAFLALALGMGGATAIFSIVNAVMLRPLPVKDGSRLVRIFNTDSKGDDDEVSMADYVEWKRSLRSFADLALYDTSQVTLTGTGSPERVVTLEVEWTLLPLLGIEPAHGRNFRADENEPGHNREAILSWPFWQSHFGGQDVLGKAILLDEKPYIVVGVLPKGFTLLGHRDALLPLSFDLKTVKNRHGFHDYEVLGRLATGISLAAANGELASVAARIADEFPNENKGVGAKATPLSSSLAGEGIGSAQGNIRSGLLVLLGAVLCVLLIACGNVANINLVRAWGRQQEMAVRVAVGASRIQLIRQTLMESVLLSLTAALAGLLLAAGLVRVFSRLPITAIPRLEETTLDWRVLGFTLLLALLTGVGSGLLPALGAGRINLNETLKQASGRTTEARSAGRLRRMFVAFETALAMMLLIECGLFVKSFTRASEIDLGLATKRILTLYLSLPPARYRSSEAIAPLIRGVLERVRAIPGVASVAAVSDLPLTGTEAGGGIFYQGQQGAPKLWTAPYVLISEISPQYFRTMRIRLLAGSDVYDLSSSAKIAIVNQALARRYFPNQNPVGKRIAVAAANPVWMRIIGVVADVPQADIEKKSRPELFFPMTNLGAPWMALAVRMNGAPLRYVGEIRAQVARVDPNVAVFLPRTMEQILEKQLLWRRLQTWVVGAFTFLAISLASLGIYAVIAYSSGQRRNEIGVRMALGATPKDVRRMILWQGSRPALLGAGAGLLAGFAAAKATANLLFATTASDVTAYAAAAGILVLVAAAASYLPAVRASRMEPWRALRHE